MQRQMSMNTRIQKGFTSVVLSQFVSFVEVLGFVPLFIQAWGVTEYGQWLSLTSFISYTMLLSLGGQEYIANLSTIAYFNKDLEAFRESLSEGVSLFAVLCVGAFIILSIIVIMLSSHSIGGGVTLSISNALIIWFVGTSYLMSIFGGVYTTAYRAVGKFSQGANFGNIWAVIRLLILTFILLLGLSSIIYAFAILVITFSRLISHYFHLIRVVPEFREVRLNFQAARRGLRHLNGALFFWLISLAGAINFQGTLLAVSAQLTPTLVALFSTHRTASNLIRYPYTMLQGPTLPEVTRLWAEKDQVRLQSLIRITVRLNAIITGLLAVALWVWIPVLYAVWTGRELKLDLGLLLLLLLQNTLYCGWATMGWVLLATNRHRLVAFCDLFNAGTTIILAVLLIPSMGLIGVVLASLTGDIIFGLVAYGYLFQRTRLISLKLLYRSLASAYLPAACIFGLVLLLSTLVQGPLYVGVSTLLLLLGAVLVLRLLLTQDQMRRIRQQLNLRAGFLARLL